MVVGGKVLLDTIQDCYSSASVDLQTRATLTLKDLKWHSPGILMELASKCILEYIYFSMFGMSAYPTLIYFNIAKEAPFTDSLRLDR